MKQPTYVFLAYGASTEIHKQTIAAICSLAAVEHIPSGYRTVLYTDSPDYYSWLNLDSIQLLSSDQLIEWMGPSRFGFRIKPCLMAAVAGACSGPLVYMDGDTVVRGSMVAAETRLLEGGALMHVQEYQVSDRRTKERREYMQRIGGVDLGGGLALGEESWMWNAGLIGLPEQHLDAPLKVIPMIDRMIACGLSTRTRLKEQLAFSLYLDARSELSDVADSVIHYWGNKVGWAPLLDRWMLELCGRDSSAAEAGRLLHQMRPYPPAIAPKKTKVEKRKAKLRKLLRLD